MKKVLNHIGGFTAGAGLSAFFVLNMNDVIYSQMRRHMIAPILNISIKDKSELGLKDVTDLGKGSYEFAKQFRPHALYGNSAKNLILEDKNYSTP